MSLRSVSFLGCLVVGSLMAHCGDSEEGDGGSKPQAGAPGDAGEPGTGGSGAAGSGGTDTGGAPMGGAGGRGGRGGTSGSSGSSGTSGEGGVSGEGGMPGGAGEGGVPDTGGQGGEGGAAPACTQMTASGTKLTLAQPTATFSQTEVYDFSVTQLIDGVTDDQRGWAIVPNTVAQTAALETATDTPTYAGGTRLSFVLTQNYDLTGDHGLGRFRLSVTTAERSMFADGVDGTATPGVVGADSIWSPLTPTSACALGGVTLTTLSDASLLASVHHIAPMTYVVVAETSLSGITGVRLEVLEDPSLPFEGPGLQSINGNFVLSELEVYAEAR